MWIVAIVLDVNDLKVKRHYTCFIVKYTSSNPKKSHLCFLILKALQIWEKAPDLIKQ